jgi:ATP-dependent RNA helicase SUPV3L1/SUV3
MAYVNAPIVKAILGPTNTGKTHYAIERMLAHSSGVIGLPLRLLAREIYDRVVAQKGAAQVALITGEEKIIPPKARFYICTVEAMPIEKRFAFLAVDEVQLMANHERGHIFTDRVLYARGLEETLFLGAETARDVLATLVPKIRFDYRERFSELHYDGPAKLTRLPKRSVIVAFSAAEVYAIAELIRRFRGGAAVVMGGLSPRTRNAQAELFQSGEVDFLVATDAVGMGLNLDTNHVAFAGLTKYDGRRRRYLTPMEAGQIAGRAGRFRNDGTFGTTGDCQPMDEELVKRIESHDFEPLHYVEWRNSDLDFSTIDSLMESLHAPRPEKRLRRIKGADDEAALERLKAIDEVHDALKTRAQVKMLWDVCQVPDFRNLTIDTHVKLLQDIWRTLIKGGGKLSNDFMASKIDRCDETLGGVDELSSRLAFIRTWTYCASKVSWMPNNENGAEHWINHAREVEDRLSDALHEALTARFVDRRTRKLLKGIGADLDMSATIKDTGEVYVDDDLIGRLDGLKFTADASQGGLEAQALAAAAQKAVGPEVNRRLTSISSGTHQIFTLSDDGQIMWGGMAVGRIAPSGSVFTPDAEVIGGELGQAPLRDIAADRMREFLRASVLAELAPLKALKDLIAQEETLPAAKGFGYILLENNGAVERREHLQTVRDLDQDARRQLRSVGVVFGHYNIYLQDMVKPKPARLLSLLVAYGAGGDKKPWIPFAGVTSIPNAGDLAASEFSPQALSLAGYRAVGSRIIRFDILNRLSFIIREAQDQFKQTKIPEAKGHKFQIMAEMLALLGSTHEDVQGVLSALGYKSEISETSLTRAPDASAESKAETRPAAGQTSDAEKTEGEKPVQVETPDLAPAPASISAPAPAPTEASAKAASDAPEADPALTAAPPIAAAPKPKPKPKKTLSLYHHRETNEAGITTEIENLEYWYFPSRGQKGFKPRGKAAFKGKRDKAGFKGPKPRRGAPRGNKPPTAKQVENSPFAALAALKPPKKD